MPSNSRPIGPEAAVTDVLWDRLGPVIVVDAPGQLIEPLLRGNQGTGTDQLRLLSTERALRQGLRDFSLASQAAELIETGRLKVRSADDLPGPPIVVTDSRVIRFVSLGEEVYLLETDDTGFVAAAYDHFTEVWAAGAEYSVREPPLTTVRTRFEETFGPEGLEEFDAMLGSPQGDGIDVVSRLVLLYDIGTWGEDVGIASRATFSRRKARLERAGVLTTEPVHREKGRPRQRLLLADDRFQKAPIEDLLRIAIDYVNGNFRGAQIPA